MRVPYNLTISKKLDKGIEKVCDKLDINKGELTRRALALYVWMQGELGTNSELQIGNKVVEFTENKDLK